MIPQLYALLAALFFGISTPFSKTLLNNLAPLQLSGLMYIGGSIGLFVVTPLLSLKKNESQQKQTATRADWIFLLFATISGGIAAPVLVLIGLQSTAAATASMLLTLESVATAILAWSFFSERINKKVWIAVALITLSAIVLSFDVSGKWSLSTGAILIAVACIMWGLDNNLSSRIKGLPIHVIVMVKSGAAGIVSLSLSFLLGNHLPATLIVFQAMILGFISCGLSLCCFMVSLRQIGASQTSSLFGTAPFIGAVISLVLFWQLPSVQMLCSLPFLVLGVMLLLRQEHSYLHSHGAVQHSHAHSHNDRLHNHHHHAEDSANGHTHEHEPAS